MTPYTIDHVHSGVHFSVRHLVVSKVRGKFGKWTADLQLDLANLTKSSVSVQIDTASIDTGVGDRDNHLRSPDFLEVEKFPHLTFKSKRIDQVGDGLKVIGDLTIKDVTHEVVLEVEFNGQQKDPWGNVKVGFDAKTSIDRKDYGLHWNKLLETGGVLVGDRIDITIEIEASSAAAKAA